MSTMRGAVLVAPRTYELRDDLPIPEIADGQILVRNRLMAVCGSDHRFFTGEPGPYKYPFPQGFSGHEALGVVERSRADAFDEGDDVLAVPCGDEGFLELFVADATRAFALPRWEDRLVIAQPLGCVLKAYRKLGDVAGKTVAVVGQGAIGLLFTQVMRVHGAETIIGIDPLGSRLVVARQVGATHVVNPADTDPLAEVTRLTHGRMADLVIEAVGWPDAQSLALELVARSGAVVPFGVPHDPTFAVTLQKLIGKQLTLVTSGNADAWVDFPVAFDLILSGQVLTDPLITHRFPIAQLNDALTLAVDRKSECIKVLVEWNDATTSG